MIKNIIKIFDRTGRKESPMKRYFHICDQKFTAELTIADGSPASSAPVEAFKEYFKSQDIEELTLNQYRRLCIQQGN